MLVKRANNSIFVDNVRLGVVLALFARKRPEVLSWPIYYYEQRTGAKKRAKKRARKSKEKMTEKRRGNETNAIEKNKQLPGTARRQNPLAEPHCVATEQRE